MRSENESHGNLGRSLNSVLQGTINVEVPMDETTSDIGSYVREGDAPFIGYSTSSDAHSVGQEIYAETPSLREVNIQPLSSGYIVRVGCQSAAIETTEALLKTLGDYLNDHVGFEKKWNANKNRNKISK